MVEDEFYSIAQSFTQHLHYAEYVRKRKEAKAQSAAAMREIERQTDDQTKMPKELQMRKEVNALAALQEPVLKQPEERGENQQNEQDDSENDDDTWAGTHLHGLMTSPRKVRSLVGGAHGMKSSTRAAAGFGRTSSFKSDSSRMVSVSQPAPPSRAAQSSTVVNDDETASDDDDDLDGGSVEVIAPRVETNTPSILSGNSIKARPQMWDKKRKSTPAKGNPGLAQPRKKPTTAFKSKVIMLFDDLDELPEPSRSNHSISDQNTSRTFSDKKANDGHHDDDRKLKPKPQYKDVPTFLV